jgi:diguanylate cyclase (GGDEF)-like protein/PAS domain S-box-containing protein
VQFALRRELEAREIRFRQLAERSPDVIMRIAFDPFRFDYISPAIEGALGVTPEDLYLDPLRFVRTIHPDDAAFVLGDVLSRQPREVLQFRVVHADASVRTVEVRSQLVHDEEGRAVALEATARDITAAADLHRHLDTLAHRDTLTGLLNRRALLAALEARLAAGTPTSVLFCDLDGFKAVNDTRGHEAGDAVLVEVAQRLIGAVRDGDLVARFAGDEFVLVSRPEGATRIADRLLARLTEPVVLADGSTVKVGTSIGIADLLDPTSVEMTADDLLKQADTAMYVAKRSGKGRAVRA